MVPDANSRQTFFRAAVVAAVVLCFAEGMKLAAFCAAQPAIRAYDSAGYWQLGAQVATGDVWMVGDPVAYRTPGYLWFLGVLQALCGVYAWKSAIALQYVAVWLTTVFTGWWTWRVTRRPWLAVATLVICVASAARPSHASVLMTETFFTLFLTLTVILLSSPTELGSVRKTALIAVLWSLAWLIRPVAAALVPAWLVACWLSQRDHSFASWRMRCISVAITASLLLASLGPWIVRNTVLFHRASLTVFLGRELWLTTFGPGQPAALPLPDTEESRRLQQLVLSGGDFSEWNGNWTVSHRLTEAGLTDVESDELMRQVSIQAITRDPVRVIARWAWRAIDFWRSVYSRSMAFYEDLPEGEHSSEDADGMWNQPQCQRFREAWLNSTWEGRLLGIEATSALALVGIAGLWLSPHTWRFGAVVTAVVLSISLLTAVVEYPSYRYRMVLEPVLIVSSIAGWNVLANVLRRGSRSLWQNASE